MARLTNILFTGLVWVPSKIAIHALMFAFDITKEQQQEQMDIIQKQIDEKLYLQSFKVKRVAKDIADADADLILRQAAEETENDPS